VAHRLIYLAADDLGTATEHDKQQYPLYLYEFRYRCERTAKWRKARWNRRCTRSHKPTPASSVEMTAILLSSLRAQKMALLHEPLERTWFLSNLGTR